jgi:general secretion pathway protein E
MLSALDTRRESAREGPFLSWLVGKDALTSLVAERVTRVQLETGDDLAAILLKLGLRSEAALAEDFATFCKLTRFDSASPANDPVTTPDINPEFMRAHELVPLRLSDSAADVLCWNALDEYGARALKFALRRTVVLRVGTRTEVRKILNDSYAQDRAAEQAESTTDSGSAKGIEASCRGGSPAKFPSAGSRAWLST